MPTETPSSSENTHETAETSAENIRLPVELEARAAIDLPLRPPTWLNDIADEEEATNEILNDYVDQEDASRWRCYVQKCGKLWQSQCHWRKHVKNRHAEWLETVKATKKQVGKARNCLPSEEKVVQDVEDDTDSLGSWQDIARVDEIEVEENLNEKLQDKLANQLKGLADDEERILKPTAHDYDAFFKAAAHGDTDGLEARILRGVNINAKTNDGYTALVMGIMEKRVAAVKCLLDNGADPHSRVRNLPPSVYAAKLAEYGPEFLQLLSDSGVNLNTVSGLSHKNVLHWAVTAGRSDVVEFLIGKGMDIEKTCGKKFTPLLLAAGLGHSQVAEILVKHGAKIDVRSDIGGTPLALSASNDHIEAVEYWLEQGAEVNSTDTDGLTPLFLASHFGSSAIVQVLLDRGADATVKSTIPKGFTPLMAAAFLDRVEALKVLIKHGCDLDVKNAADETALDLAIMKGNLGAVQVLLEAMSKDFRHYHPGDSISLQIALSRTHAETKAFISSAMLMYPFVGSKFETPGTFAWMEFVLNEGGSLVKPRAMQRLLQVALEDQNSEMITVLAQHGCDLNVLLGSGRTPLLLALKRGDVDLVKALLHAGADPNQPDADQEQYPLNYAVDTMKSAEDTEMVDLLLNHGRCKINQGSGPFTTAFSYVLAKVDEWPIPCAVDLAMRMLDTVEDVNDDRCAVGTTLLHVAVLRGREDIVDRLLKREAQLETVDSFGITPILLACQCTTKMIFPLYERGANIFATMQGGAGALAIAAGADHEDTDALKMLIEIGLDPNARSEMGHTPLLAALHNSREESALYLIDQGVNVHLTTRNKQITALHFAARGGLARVVEKLLQNPNIDIDAKSADEWTPLQKACCSGSPKVVQMLLDAGADMERARPNGDRPLHLALLNERDDVAALLLRHGADATVRTVKNDTPLHIAVANAHLLSTLILLDKGVSTEDIDEDIHTPLCCSPSPAITKLLIERGANIHYADADNWTPLHQAVFNSDLETCAALLRAGADVYVRTTDDGLNIIERAMDIVDEGTRDSFLRLLMGAEEGVNCRRRWRLDSKET